MWKYGGNGILKCITVDSMTKNRKCTNYSLKCTLIKCVVQFAAGTVEKHGYRIVQAEFSGDMQHVLDVKEFNP